MTIWEYVINMLNLRYLLDIQVEMQSRQLNIRIRIQGERSGLEILIWKL